MVKWDNLINKILEIIEEDYKKYDDFILRYDLDNMLTNEINPLIDEAYRDGYESAKQEYNWEEFN